MSSVEFLKECLEETLTEDGKNAAAVALGSQRRSRKSPKAQQEAVDMTHRLLKQIVSKAS